MRAVLPFVAASIMGVASASALAQGSSRSDQPERGSGWIDEQPVESKRFMVA